MEDNVFRSAIRSETCIRSANKRCGLDRSRAATYFKIGPTMPIFRQISRVPQAFIQSRQKDKQDQHSGGRSHLPE